MTAVPTPQELALLTDAEVQQLASQWRARAAHGVRDAFGMAHSYEVESRQRSRAQRQGRALAMPDVPQRTWWRTVFSPARDGTALLHS